MKKLLGIVVLGLFLSGNAYSKIISLNCDNSDKIFEKSEIKIDTKKKRSPFLMYIQMNMLKIQLVFQVMQFQKCHSQNIR